MAGKGHQLACSETSTPTLMYLTEFLFHNFGELFYILALCLDGVFSKLTTPTGSHVPRVECTVQQTLQCITEPPTHNSIHNTETERQIFGRLTDEQMYKKHRGTHFSFAAVMRSILCRTSSSAAANLLCNAPSSCPSSYTVWSTASSLCKAPCSLLAVTCRGKKWKRKGGQEGN